MTKNNYYILSGGPGSGKTSLLQALNASGYHYVEETARQIIKDRLSKGLSPRPDPKFFAEEIFNKDLENYLTNVETSELIFFDRSLLDSAWQLFKADPDTYSYSKDIIAKHRYNERVFMAAPWKNIFTNDPERDQTFEQSIEIFDSLKEWYLTHGYEIIFLPNDRIENRMSFLLNKVKYT